MDTNPLPRFNVVSLPLRQTSGDALFEELQAQEAILRPDRPQIIIVDMSGYPHRVVTAEHLKAAAAWLAAQIRRSGPRCLGVALVTERENVDFAWQALLRQSSCPSKCGVFHDPEHAFAWAERIVAGRQKTEPHPTAHF